MSRCEQGILEIGEVDICILLSVFYLVETVSWNGSSGISLCRLRSQDRGDEQLELARRNLDELKLLGL